MKSKSLFHGVLIELKKSRDQIWKYLKLIGASIRFCFIRIQLLIDDDWNDKRLGVDTAENLPVAQDTSLYKDANHYQPTPYRILKETVESLQFKEDDVLVDFGSGKGRVVFLMAQCNIKKVVGLELQRDLFDMAQSNLKNLRRKKSAVEFLNMDAVEYDCQEGTVFFIFNSFGEKTLTKVVENIERSLTARPRSVQAVYLQPTYSNVFARWAELKPKHEIKDTKIFVWKNRS